MVAKRDRRSPVAGDIGLAVGEACIIWERTFSRTKRTWSIEAHRRVRYFGRVTRTNDIAGVSLPNCFPRPI